MSTREESIQLVTPHEKMDVRLRNKRVRTETTNKQVKCKVCLRKMRSDNLKRHMLKHRKLHSLNEDEIHEEVKRRKKLRETIQEQLVRQIADEEGLPPSIVRLKLLMLTLISVEKELMDDDQIYTRKIERGKIISNTLERDGAREDSFSKNNREVLNCIESK